MLNSVIKPIRKVTRAARQIGSGDFDVNLEVKGKDEITDLSSMINKTAKDLAKAQKEKEEFAAMITHDLKQPLVPIKGNCKLLENPKMGPLNEMQKSSVDEIQTNSIHLANMIENLLTSFKIGASALKFDIVELSTKEILGKVIKDQSPLMEQKNIQYSDSSDDEYTVMADKRRILETFTNIVQNAVDFVPDTDGKIEIGAKKDGEFVEFHVKDNGAGIPKDKQEKLFEKYFQVETTQTRHYGGTGLGLAICQELVQGMGGKIWVESIEGKGTTFYFTIPCKN